MCQWIGNTHLFNFVCVVDEEQVWSANQSLHTNDLSILMPQVNCHFCNIRNLVLAYNWQKPGRDTDWVVKWDGLLMKSRVIAGDRWRFHCNYWQRSNGISYLSSGFKSPFLVSWLVGLKKGTLFNLWLSSGRLESHNKHTITRWFSKIISEANHAKICTMFVCACMFNSTFRNVRFSVAPDCTRCLDDIQKCIVKVTLDLCSICLKSCIKCHYHYSLPLKASLMVLNVLTDTEKG